jgi:glutamine amidotransferase
MCRFVAYISKKKILLSDILYEPKHSLICQSHHATEGIHPLNADGLGIAWYDQDIDALPGVFKSILPAWNDQNLRHLASKTRSNCFLGHVRASTVGDVAINSCHPFYHKEFSFVHNGTIFNFNNLKRRLLNELSDKLIHELKANTDSEYLFWLIMNAYYKKANGTTLDAVITAFQQLEQWQNSENDSHHSILNTVLSNGKELVATRYVSKNSTPYSLYYTDWEENTVIVASEPINEKYGEWKEVPLNHYLHINKNLDILVEAFPFQEAQSPLHIRLNPV